MRLAGAMYCENFFGLKATVRRAIMTRNISQGGRNGN